MSRELEIIEDNLCGNVKFTVPKNGLVSMKLVDGPKNQKWVPLHALQCCEDLTLASVLPLLTEASFLKGLEHKHMELMLDSLTDLNGSPSMADPSLVDEFNKHWTIMDIKRKLYEDCVAKVLAREGG